MLLLFPRPLCYRLRLGKTPRAGGVELKLRANREQSRHIVPSLVTGRGAAPGAAVAVIQCAVAARDGTLATTAMRVKQTLD